MSDHIKTGNLGESRAAEYFIERGYLIHKQNWRYKNLEVDIIAEKFQVLHFIEVKTRTSSAFGFPEDNVTEKKLRSLIEASSEFLYQHPQWQRIQFDILAVTISPAGETGFFLIEDVYL